MSVERIGLIYQILNLENGKSYVGQTVQTLKARQKAHLSLLRRKIHPNPHLQSNYDFYGENSFRFIQLENDVLYSDLCHRESFWADFVSAEYNIALAGHGPMFGRKHTKEALEKIANASKGNKNTLGKKASEETRRKISEAGKGHNRHTPETRAKIGAIHRGNKHALGRKQTDEAKEKIRIARMGNKHSLGFKHTFQTRVNMSNAQKNNKPVKQIDAKTGEVIKVWHSISWAGSQLGINRIAVSRAANGKSYTSGGFKWELV